MATKFYLLDGATSDTGTLPASTNSNDTSAAWVSSVIVTGASTARDANTTISVTAGQRSGVLTTLANTSAQRSLLRRFVSAPLAAQTMTSQTITVGAARSESNTNSVFQLGVAIFLWRPGTGAFVSEVQAAQAQLAATASEVWGTSTFSSNQQSCLDGDILVFEIWRDNAVQTMGTAYTNTFFYDGTTEGSATTPASYVDFANTVMFYTVAAQVPYTNPMPQLLAQ
jgi:hypothetical protein